MRKPSDYQGDFSILLGDEKLEKNIVSAEFFGEVDEESWFSVTVAQNGEGLRNLKPSQHPQEASFKWQDKGVFKGALARAYVSGFSRVSYVFRDSLHKARKVCESEYVRQKNLKQYLDGLMAKFGLKSRFEGNFSQAVLNFNQEGKTLYEHITDLSMLYGFYFLCRSFLDTVYFIKLGESIRESSIDCNDQVADVSLGQVGEGPYDEVTIRYFDPRTMEIKEKRLSRNDLLRPISPFTGHGGYQEKLKWKPAKGKIELHTTDQQQFEASDKMFQNQISKVMMNQENINIRCFEPLGLPGDKIQVKNAPNPAVQDGDYFVRSLHVSIGSSTPVAEIVAIRP